MITLKTKIKDIMSLFMDHKTLSKKCKWKPWSIASEMTLDEFLKDSYRLAGFGKVSYRKIIRAAVFNDNIEHNTSEKIIKHVI